MRPVSGFTDLALSPLHLASADLGAPSQRPARRRLAPDPSLRTFGSLSGKPEFRAACHPMCAICAICWGGGREMAQMAHIGRTGVRKTGQMTAPVSWRGAARLSAPAVTRRRPGLRARPLEGSGPTPQGNLTSRMGPLGTAL